MPTRVTQNTMPLQNKDLVSGFRTTLKTDDYKWIVFCLNINREKLGQEQNWCMLGMLGMQKKKVKSI